VLDLFFLLFRVGDLRGGFEPPSFEL
jgi:hypothetical protein